MIGGVEEGVYRIGMHDVAVGREMMVVVEEGWWLVVRGHDVAYGDRSGVHGGDVVGDARGSVVGIATGCRGG